MNIKEAKEQISNAMKAYFTKDEFGNYAIPIERQRPVFLMGPPGVGKTAIMEQIAAELGVGLVSYSMTHHTRQSALGLPFIVNQKFEDYEYQMSEYTMSEIIGSIYALMRQTDIREGILFLDEINCVSETLAPCMLQFLQYKVFGRHSVPEGWIVVTAGNPPEYNQSVREFDIVTWDRLKRIDVEPDYDAWKEYAYRAGTHASVMTYLDIKKSDFYKIETTVDGKSFVTARGWDDLSDMIKLYEKNGIPVDEKLVSQYVQNKKIAKDFAVYYDLYNKYKSDYQVDKILNGKADESIRERAKKAKFDERLTLVGLLLDGVTVHLRAVCNTENSLTELMKALKNVRLSLARPDADAAAALHKELRRIENEIESGEKASSLSADDAYARRSAKAALAEISAAVAEEKPVGGTAAFALIKKEFDKRTAALKKESDAAGEKLGNVFAFCESVFGFDGREILILVTELTISYYGARFISRYGCKEYFAHNKELLFYERQKQIITELENLDLDD